jgi:hypothetical protein
MARGIRWGLAGCAVAAVAGVVAAGTGGAQTPGVTVVADHLNNPRGVTIAPDGSVYVAEGGSAGPSCFGSGDQRSCLGFTSSITRVSGGVATRVVKGLMSGGGPDGTFAGGPNGVSVTANGTIYMIMGGFGCGPLPPQVPARARLQVGRLLKFGPAGRLSRVANMTPLECRTNPDGTDRNPNPYGVLALGNGHEVVADAGGNTLVDVIGRKASALTVFPLTKGRQFVPTSIALGPDGAYYVGGLDEGLGKGGARVFRVEPGSKPTVFRKGFTNITGVAFGPDGSLYVTQMTTAGLEANKPAGSVVRVAPDGTRTELGKGSLFFPQGAAVDAAGGVYVSNWSVLPGKAAPAGPFKGKNGQLLRIAQ